MTIAITTSGIALDGPLVAGEKVAVTVSGLALAAEDKPTLALLARFPDALLASVELAEDADAPGTWTGELDTATKQTALFFAAARADERRDAALELVSGRVSLARLTVPMANSALCPKPDGSPFASPVYIPVPGPPGTGGDPYDQPPEMDGEASAGSADEYARGDHRHPTDTTRQAVIADLDAIRSGAAAGATAVQPAALAAVATTGDYADLTNKPTIPAAQIQSDWNQTNSAAVDYIKNKPTIPGPAPVTSVNGETGDVAIYGNTLIMAQGQSTIVSTAIANAQSDATRALNELPSKAADISIAPAFSASSTYAVGDYVTHEGLLYKCTTAVTTAGAWNAADWTAVAVTDEMGADTPLPFDAECEYVTVPAGAYIDPDVLSTTIGLGVEIAFRVGEDTASGSFFFGLWSGQQSSSFQLYGNSVGDLKLIYYQSSIHTVSKSPFVNQFGVAKVRGNVFTNGTSSVVVNPAVSAKDPAPFLLCASNIPATSAIPVDISRVEFDTFGVSLRSLAPVRVGTVGYLYDKVSGRLFGSAVPSIPLVPGPDKAQPTITTPGRIVELTPAIRYSLPAAISVSDATSTAALADRAVNTVTVGSAVTTLNLTFPAAVAGYARDFFVRLDCAGTALATIAPPSGETVDFGADALAGLTGKAGVHLALFTEIAANHWLISAKEAEA